MLVSPQQTLDWLVAARALIAQPGVWYKGGSYGYNTEYQMKLHSWEGVVLHADCVCGYGALMKVYGATIPDKVEPWTDISRAMEFLNRSIPLEDMVSRRWGSFASWQDDEGRTLEQVLAAFDRAIDAARAAL